MVNDPIADMLIQIKNASRVGKRVVEIPYSRLRMAVATVMAQEGYIERVEKVDSESKHKSKYKSKDKLRISLKYYEGKPVITDLKRTSKPGMRVYVTCEAIPQVVGGMGMAIVSTSQGIMTGREAKKRGVGGELLCKVW